MAEFGYALSSEEHRPNDLVRYAREAEAAGFAFALISDHFHPWTDSQGQSPFVWSVLGAIAHSTEQLRVGTGVTCPLIRTHPVVIAQAAATTAAMMPGRFFLGVGTGENLNEHITGARWPLSDERRDMLEEAVSCIRELWKGEDVTHRGRHYTIEQARIYTLPDEPPPIYVAASGERSAKLAGKIGDAFIGTSPKRETLDAFHSGGGGGKPTYGQVSVCYASDEKAARKTLHEIWPNAGLPGELTQELRTPAHFEQASETVTEDMLAEQMPVGPDAGRYIEAIQKYVEAGYDHVYIHQVGPDQTAFFRFYQSEILPELSRSLAA
jgi:coenzyme F420-dependent glucose-6-phosphate dehydrogenase